MLKKLRQLYTRQSGPRAYSNTSLILWAVLGFALGFSPIIIFLGFIPAAKNDKPALGHASQGMMAYQQPVRTRIETPAPPPDPATTIQALPATEQVQTTTLPAVTPTPAVTTTPTAVIAPAVKKQAGARTAAENKAVKTFKQAPKTQKAATTAAKPAAVARAEHSPAPRQPQAGADNIATRIVYQSWEQNSPGSIFPRARAIDCTASKGDVVCWTDVLTGKHHSREYRYKVKIIFDRFRADGQFVMTYRNLVLSSSGKPANEEAGGLGALPETMQPGWEPMIHRLPCQLTGQDKIICHPIGEAQFVFTSTAVKTSLKK